MPVYLGVRRNSLPSCSVGDSQTETNLSVSVSVSSQVCRLSRDMPSEVTSTPPITPSAFTFDARDEDACEVDGLFFTDL